MVFENTPQLIQGDVIKNRGNKIQDQEVSKNKFHMSSVQKPGWLFDIGIISIINMGIIKNQYI